ncbi:transcription termination/antitermination NusG family protein [Oricola sp.]|uniref:transcription termination/antitermination protein NusG n=1 Tax=Oricola sp. TaxID=1979950 RepID=UPI0025E6DE6C|nr:transcription termination/antitermination NusG family protein [Oricola sp.]MCI5073637.1 hypothetical protein [Oricola sp.]
MPFETGKTDARWYVVATRPAREALAAQQLENQSFEVFLPKRKATIRHARKLITKTAPLFPGYVFVRMCVDTVRWQSINGTMGVKFILMQDERPIALPKGFVESLQGFSDAEGFVSYAPQLKVGDTVTLMSGPFAKQVGELISMDDRGRVEVLMRFVSSIAVKTSQDNLIPA